MSELKGACHHRSVRRPHFRHQRQCLRRDRNCPEEPDCITRVLGAEHGIKGVLNDRLFDMGQEDPAELELLQYTPSSALGSCRYKMADPDVGRHRLQAHSGDLQEV